MAYIGKRYLNDQEVDMDEVRRRPIESERIALIIERVRRRRAK